MCTHQNVQHRHRERKKKEKGRKGERNVKMICLMVCSVSLNSKFKDYVRMTSSVVDRLTVSGANIIQESNKLTIFAPINGAFVNLERAGNLDLTQNATLRKMVSWLLKSALTPRVDIYSKTSLTDHLHRPTILL